MGKGLQSSCGSPLAIGIDRLRFVFVDPNNDGVLATLDDRIKVYESLSGGRSLATSQTRITYSAEGFVSSGAGNYTLQADACTGPFARQINISNSGRISMTAVNCI